MKKDRKVFDLPRASTAPPVREVSDKAQLTYNRFILPATQAIQAVQNALGVAQVMVVEIMAEMDGIDTSKGWKFNTERNRWEQYPVQLPEE